MEVTPTAPAGATSPPAVAPPSRWGRAAAIFSSPGAAWAGLEARPQWWFPLLVMAVLSVAFTVTLHERAIMPMITERWEQLVDAGQMSPEQLEQMEAGLRGPGGLLLSAGQQLIAWPLFMLVLGLGISFGVGFVLGTRLKFRLAFEVANWSSLVLIPSYGITWVLAWSRETMQGIHLGLGVLVPQSDRPERLQVALASFLDALGPFNLWYLAVAVIGATALSGAARKSVAWVLSALYLGLAVFVAALGALFTPGS